MIHLLRRALAALVLLAAAVVLQVSLVNRVPLPGGTGPSLVILVVAALSVTSGPVVGMIAGFLGGLALDIAPPGSDLVGENALVCCLVGYGCGALAAWQLAASGAPARVAPDGRVVPVTPFTSASASGMWEGAARKAPLRMLPLMAAGAVVAEALQAGLGMLLSDPSMTLPAVLQVLPAAVTYDLLLSPFVLLLVAALQGTSKPRSAARGSAPVILLATPKPVIRARAALRAADDGFGIRPGAVPRLTFSGARPAPVRAAGRPEPKFKFAGARPAPVRAAGRPEPKLKFSGARPAPVRAAGRPEPKLKFASGSGSSSSRTGSPIPRTAGGPRGSGWLRDVGAGRRRDGSIGGSVLGSHSLRFGFGGSSGGFRGALGPSLFAGGGARRGGVFRGGVFRGGVFRGGGLRSGWLRSGAYRGTALGGGAPANGAFRGSAPRGSAFRGSGARSSMFRGSDARSGTLGSSALAGRAARSSGIGGRAFQDKKAFRSEKRTMSGPGKGWLRPARPPAPVRRATPGRGWLSRKPPKLTGGRMQRGGR